MAQSKQIITQCLQNKVYSFSTRQKPITVSDTITLDNIAVQQVEVTKFLGV